MDEESTLVGGRSAPPVPALFHKTIEIQAQHGASCVRVSRHDIHLRPLNLSQGKIHINDLSILSF